jgi:phosphate-selective porin OprO/OprP
MTSLRSLAVASALVTAMLIPAPAEAQAPATASPLVAGWQDGFFVQSANGDYHLVFSVTAQMDGRFSLDDPKPIINAFTIRKARPTLSGRVAKYFDFKLMPDLGNGTAVVLDAYFDVRFSPRFRVRTGKDKSPIGYELLIGDPNIFFPERSLGSSLVPNRDIGVQIQGDIDGGKVSYAGGVFNGVPDGTSSTTELDANNGKDLAGRIVVQPFRTASSPAGPASGMGFQIGGSSGAEMGALPSFKTSVGQTYFSYAPTVSADGVRHRVTPAVFYFYKAVGAFGEYFRSSQVVTKGSARTDVVNEAWDVTGSFFLTGEAASIGTTRPHNNFDPPNHHGGALQIVARYADLKVDGDVFTAGLAGAGSSREAKAFTIGVNWFPAPYIKYYVTFERTTFDDHVAGSRPVENVLLFRTQLAF